MYLIDASVRCKELNRGSFKPRTLQHSLYQGIVGCSLYFSTKEVIEHFNNKNITDVKKYCMALKRAVGAFMDDKSLYLSKDISIRADGLVLDDGTLKGVSFDIGGDLDVYEIKPIEGRFFITGTTYLKGSIKYIDPADYVG